MKTMVVTTKTLELTNGMDLIKARQLARDFAKDLGFNIVDQTKIITAVSELVRNVLEYASRGTLIINSIMRDAKKGIFISIIDQGPGIEDLELAMTDGYSTSGGLGKGLIGTKRLMDEFEIKSELGVGTEVKIIKWVKQP